MTTAEIYAHPRYLELSDQIENASRLIQAHLKELNERFPPAADYEWIVSGTGIPRLFFVGEIG